MSGIDNLPRGFAYEEISIVGLFKEGNMASVDGYVVNGNFAISLPFNASNMS
jgi:hypothetical protein